MSIIIIILLVCLIIMMIFKWRKLKMQMPKERKPHQHTSKALEKEDNGYKKQRQELEMQYGKPTITIHFANNDIYSDVDVFEEKQLIRLGKDLLPFSKVVSHNVLHEPHINYGQQVHYEGLNFAHYTDQSDSIIKDDVTISVATGDIANPTIFFYAGTEQKDVQMLVDILSIIEKRNKKA